MEISGSDFTVVRGRVMFGEIICSIERASLPFNVKLVLCFSVLKPMETHVHCFGAVLFGGIGGNAKGCSIVGIDQGRWLFMT